jgi:hypothetical protein
VRVPEDWSPPSLAAQVRRKCVYFNGIGNETCEAGVRYEDVMRDEAERRSRYPCLRGRTRKGQRNPPDTCPKRRWPTEDEVQEHVEASEAMLDDFLSKLKADTCPHCDADVERHRQAGRCVYAEPCGHRLYQGRARTVNGNPPAGDVNDPKLDV